MAAEEKKKPGLAEIVIGAGKEDSDDPEESMEDYDAAVSELFDAVKAGDESAFKESFKAAVMSCK